MEKTALMLLLLLLPALVNGEETNSTYLTIKSYVDVPSNDSSYNKYLQFCSRYDRAAYHNICMSPYYVSLLSNFSAQEILQLAEYRELNTSASDCYLIAHEIGLEVYKKNNRSITSSIKECGDTKLCNGGCHKQLFVEFMKNNGPRDLLDARDLICKNDNRTLPRNFKHACFNSFGHSIFLYYQYNVDYAKQFCKDLKSEFLYDCYDGIYEQHYFSFLNMGFVDILNDPKVFCKSGLEGIDRKACYERAGKFALVYYGFHNKEAFEQGMVLCSHFNKVDKTRCINGLLTVRENCNLSAHECDYLVVREKFLSWFYSFIFST